MKTKLNTNIPLRWSTSLISLVDIYGNSTLIENDIDASLGAYTIQLSSLAFIPNQTVAIKVKDAGGVAYGSENINTISTVALVEITGIVADEDYDFEATTDGLEVEFFKRVSSPVGEWVSMGTATAVGGNCMLTTSVGAGTWDFKVEDTTDTDGNDSQSGVVVLDPSISITSIPETSAVDTDMTISGDSEYIAESETITLKAKKSTQAWTSGVTIGTATVGADGSWETAIAELDSGDFEVDDTVNVKAVYGSVESSVNDVVVASGTWIPDGSELYLFMDGTTNISKIPISPDYTLTGIDSGDITQIKNVSASSVSPNFGMTFTPNRKKLLIFKSDRNMYELTLGTAGDLSTIATTPTASVDLSATIGTSSGSSFQVSPDGKYIFIYDGTYFHRFTMSTAWDITTAGSVQSLDMTSWLARSACITPDGNRIYYQDNTNSRLRYRTLTTTWDLLGGASYVGYVLLTGLYNYSQMQFSTDKRTIFFLCATSATQPTLLKYIPSLTADYDITGKVIGDVVSVDSSLDNTSFAFGV